jgi:hypothetical protein
MLQEEEWVMILRRYTSLACALALAACVGLFSGCRARPPEPPFQGEPYLLVWAGDADRRDSDFLAVIDVDPTSATYGVVVNTLPVGSRGNEPHAMETSRAPDGLVFAGGLLTDRTFVFDVSEPYAPRLVHVDTPGPTRRFGTPRAYARRSNGNRIAACGDRRGYRGGVLDVLYSAAGLVEFDRNGRFLRELDTRDPEAAGMLNSPHGIALSEETRRLVVTDAGHGYTATAIEWTPGVSVQVWESSTGDLVQTIPLGVGQRGDENLGPNTVHFLKRGTEALVSSSEGSALYLSRSIANSTPVFSLVYDFGRGALGGQAAVTPNERYYLQALTDGNRLDVLNISDPTSPRLVNRLRFDRDPAEPHHARVGGPHGLALSADGQRLAVSNYTIDVPARRREGDRRVYMVHVDPRHGGIGFDLTFRDEVSGAVGVDFNRTSWPHGVTGPARPAAVLFAVPSPVPGQRAEPGVARPAPRESLQ